MSSFSEKFEFGDFYRFSVSLGLILVFASLAVPWLVMKDASLLDYHVAPTVKWTSSNIFEELSKVPPPDLLDARGRRVGSIVMLYKALPWVAGLFLVLGIGFFCFGLRSWWRRQLRRDTRENKEIDDFLADLPKGSTAEVDAKNTIEEEVEDADAGRGATNEAASSQGPHSFVATQGRGKYSRVERAVLGKLQTSFVGKYDVYQNRKLGRTLIDGLMVARSDVREDLIVEVKLINRGFKSGWLHEVLQSTARLVDLYDLQFDRVSRGLVIIVLDGEALDWVREGNTVNWIAERSEATSLVNIRLVPIKALSESAGFDDVFVSGLPQVHSLT